MGMKVCTPTVWGGTVSGLERVDTAMVKNVISHGVYVGRYKWVYTH